MHLNASLCPKTICQVNNLLKTPGNDIFRKKHFLNVKIWYLHLYLIIIFFHNFNVKFTENSCKLSMHNLAVILIADHCQSKAHSFGYNNPGVGQIYRK